MQTSFIANPTLAGTDPIDALRLIRSEQVGSMTFFHLLKFCGSVARALEMAPEMSRRGGRKKPIVLASRAAAEREYAALRAMGAELLLYGTPNYPRLLTTLADAPPILTLRGHASFLSSPKIIGMVGARNASANGCAFARKLSADLGAAGFVVASGLARGLDAAAHRGALATGTIAVIGGGIDTVYPPENAKLYEEIIAQGALLSELPLGTAPHARSFPARNRIIAGMSRGLVVVEAALKSGSLITAENAADYGREVFAVPGSPMDPRCAGTNGLIKQGATLVEGVQDILAHLPALPEIPMAEPDPRAFKAAPPTLPSEEILAEIRASVLAHLSYNPTLLDELLIAVGTTPHLLMAVLLELELAGRLQRHAGARVSLTIGDPE